MAPPCTATVACSGRGRWRRSMRRAGERHHPRSRGRLWFATSNGLYRWRKATSARHYGEREGLRDIRVRVLMETRDGRLLVGTQSGLYEFVDEHLVQVPLTGTGLDAPHIVSLYELAGGQWLAGALSEELMLRSCGHRWTRLDKSRGIGKRALLFRRGRRRRY